MARPHAYFIMKHMLFPSCWCIGKFLDPILKPLTRSFSCVCAFIATRIYDDSKEKYNHTKVDIHLIPLRRRPQSSLSSCNLLTSAAAHMLIHLLLPYELLNMVFQPRPLKKQKSYILSAWTNANIRGFCVCVCAIKLPTRLKGYY